MQKVNDQEVWRARQDAASAVEILEAAGVLNAAVVAYFEKPGAGQELGLSLMSASGDEAFSLRTPYGHVEVVFDMAIKNGGLVGRYSFYLLRSIGAGNVEAECVWSMLINRDCFATWSVDEDFAWYFGDQSIHTPDRITRFLLTVLAHVQRALPVV
jgi:hypothetical protein